MTQSEILNRHGERIDHSFHPGSRMDSLVIMGHGVTGNKDRPHLIAIAEGLAELGWSSLRISFSGNGASDGSFESSCITKEIGDLQAVLATVPNEVRVAYLGHSMGGAVGVLTAARDMRIQVLISLAGMTHTAAFVDREFGDVTPGVGCMWEDESFPLSQTYVDDLRGIEDTLSAAEAVTQPWLLIHGSADDIVPVQDSRDAFEAAKCQKQLLEIPDVGHAFHAASYPKIIEAVDSWLSAHFGV
ncbi:MAG: prolyl oligopeptidase family serine peptidase [Akkermansiaceae bacterium]|nr:prolyl oligopeptidase family serine peptidase [Akkermansiaceae bacterium]